MFNLNVSRMGRVGRITLTQRIRALFANSEQGAWYDPSDFTTLFQDSAGTLPVTAVGQPVGRMLDKRLGLVPGPELVVNGDLSNGATGFTAVNATISVVGGSLRVAKTDIYGQGRTSIPTVAGKTYKVSALLTGSTSGLVDAGVTIGLVAAANDVIGNYVTGAGQTSALIFTAVGATSYLQLISSASTGYDDWDNISVRELPGNHATQPTATKRPVLRQDANGKYYLDFDGVDDSLVTGAIDFTATDKMTVVGGASSNKGSVCFLYSCGNTDTLGNGGHEITFEDAVNSITGRTGNAAKSQRTATINNANSNVISVSFNMLGATTAEEQIIRVNGTVPASSNRVTANDSGFFGNNPLTIGARDSTYCLKGRIYSLIVRGAASSDAQIISAETYANSKTGAY